VNESHETSNLPDEPAQDINLHERVDDLDAIDRMISRYFTPERLDQQWQRIVKSVYGAGQSRGNDSPDPALTGQDEPYLLGTSRPGASDASRAPVELAASPVTAVPGAGSVFPRRARVCLAQSRDVSRAAHSAVDVSESLAVPGRDLRVMSHGDREETRARTGELRELLGRCPAGAFGAEDTAMVLATVARLSETLITDRDERAALRLIRAASPHMGFLGRRHPAVLEVRRTWAEALSELGWYPQAETRLRGLSEDEQRVFGSADPRTALLLLWVLVGQGRLREADGGFRSLEDRLTRSQGAGTLVLWHLRCRHSWLQGRLGQVDKSVSDYARVIVSRTNELGEDHADTLDARHSQGKILVVAGQGSQALPFLQALADDRARVQGDRHPDTLETLKYLHLAHVLANPRDDRVLARAIRELVKIDRIQRKRHGQDHPIRQDTAASLRKLLRGEPISGLRHVPIADEEHRQTISRSRSHGTSRNTQSTPEQPAR